MYSVYLVLLPIFGLGSAQPSLVSFSLSLTPPELLTLTFDTALPDSTCDATKLTLQNSSTNLITGGYYSPEKEGSCSFVGGLTVTLNAALSSSDWAAIQANLHLATESTNTFLSMQTGFLSQGSNSPISSSAAIQVTPHLFLANTNPPSVVEVQLDLNAGILTLRLYEGSVYLASGSIEFMDTTEFGGEFTLTNYTTPNNVEFFYTLPLYLLHSLKLASPPFSVSLPTGLFRDSSGSTSPAQTRLSVTLFPDTTPPAIVSFTFDLDEGSLALTFDEPINPGSINLTTGIYLIGDSQGSNGSVSVLADDFSTGNQETELLIAVSTSTLNLVKVDTNLCTSLANCLLGVSSGLINDTSGNRVPISSSNIAADLVIEDMTRPQLVSYTINLDTSSVGLTFSEPINPLNFDPSGITFDLAPDDLITSGGDLIQYQPVTLGEGSSIADTTTQNTVIILRLEPSLLVNLKLLFTTGNIICTVNELTAEDTNGNRIIPVNSTTAFTPSQIVIDQSPPRLLDFIAGSPESRQLTLVFSKPVDLTSWNISALVLTLLTTEGSYDYVFSEGRVEGNDILNSVTFTIDDSEYMLSALSEHYQDAYVRGSLGITTRGSLIEDLFGNQLQPVTQPLIFNATISGQSPKVLAVDFDLDTGRLDLTFSDVVVASFSAGKVRFQDNLMFPGHTLTLAGNGSYTSGGLSTSLSLTLASQDLNGLKLNPFLATSADNTFVALSEDFAYGLGSIPIETRNMTQVRLFTPDTTEPMVTRFELDLDSDTFLINFDEPVPADTFDESRILLVNSTTISLSDAGLVHLTAAYTLAQGNVISFRALISDPDTIDIKRKPLCYSINNCFVVFDEALVRDVSGNVFLGSVAVMQVNLVSPDVTPPQLLSFPVFDLDSGLFILVFSEPVNGSSTGYTLVEFHSVQAESNVSLTLTEGFTSEDHTEIVFHMSPEDLNRLKSDVSLCTDRDNCWIRLPSFFVTDIGMNPFIHSRYESDAVASFHQPTLFIPDQTSPTLDNATIDLNQGTLTLSFSEVIVETTFAASDITLLQYPSSSLSLTLSPSSVFSLASFGAAAIIYLSPDDLNWLKANNLFTSTDNSFLSLTTNLVDVSGNRFQNIPQSVGFRVWVVVPDQTGPRLVSFDHFNLENNSLVVSFDEPVDAATLNVTRVTLVSQPSSDASTYTLTGAADISATDDSLLSVAITLTISDRVQIKLTPSLATVRSNTFIALGEAAVIDRTGNTNFLISLSEAVPLSTGGYRADVSPANLVGFGLDLNSPLLSLMFDDVIASSSVDPTSLTIQNSATSPTSSVTLSISSRPINGNSDRINISISEEDLLRLKLDLNLATSAAKTYISIESSFATDIEDRPVAAIQPSLALSLPSPSSFIPDTTSPYLSVFSLDMDNGILQLNFSEPISPSSVDPSQLTLHGQSSGGGGSSLTLSQTTPLLTATDASLIFELKLTQYDMNYIKNAQDLAIDTGTTFMSFTSHLVSDVSGNSIESVPPNASIPAAGFVIDTTPPVLQGFDADLTPTAKLYLTFSETVRQVGKIETSISLMNAPGVDAKVIIQLTEADESNQTGFSTVEISLSPPVITRLLVDAIADSVDSLYLSLSDQVVTDTSGTPVTSVTSFKVQKLYKSCFSNTYNNVMLGECLDCPSDCCGSCSGPNTTVGTGGCDSCSVLLLDQEGNQLTCTDPTASSCPLGYFSTSLSALPTSLPPTITDSTLLCQQCHSLCSSCDGPSTSDCLTCSSAFLTNSTSAQVACLESCDGTTASDCTACHKQCCGCTGPTNRDCVVCREDSVKTGQGELVCVPQCEGNTFLSTDNGVYTCSQCHSQCVGCRASRNTDCITCRNANLTANGTCTCVAVCPTGYYQSRGSCLPCHEYCVGCTGPSNRNCTECVEDEVEVEGGERECVPSCSYGREYDTSEEECVLTRQAFYLSIAAGAVGGIILLLLVLLTAVFCCFRYKKKKDKMGVFFVSANFDTTGQELRSLRNT